VTVLPKTGDLIADKYEIESLLGSGGMGAVFSATHRWTGKRVALKWLLPELIAREDVAERFMREAQVGGRVMHPNVVDIHDFGQADGSFYMVMELLQGEDLGTLLERKGKLSVTEACRILIPLSRGLDAAHKAGVIHRDLKPENVFICRNAAGEEVPKVLDFGISKMRPLIDDASWGGTTTGVIIGTPHYMSPEQLRSQPVDARSDVYALGVLLHQLLSGALPFPAQNYSDLIVRVLTLDPEPLGKVAPEAPPALIEIVIKAMARDPDNRFDSVEQLARALEPFADGMLFGIAALPTPLESPGRFNGLAQPRKSSLARAAASNADMAHTGEASLSPNTPQRNGTRRQSGALPGAASRDFATPLAAESRRRTGPPALIRRLRDTLARRPSWLVLAGASMISFAAYALVEGAKSTRAEATLRAASTGRTAVSASLSAHAPGSHPLQHAVHDAASAPAPTPALGSPQLRPETLVDARAEAARVPDAPVAIAPRSPPAANIERQPSLAESAPRRRTATRTRSRSRSSIPRIHPSEF
jgi:serine/threonine protein kinase